MAGRNDPNKQALLKNRPNIVQNLENPDDVAAYLYAIGLFTEEMQAAVVVSIMNLFYFLGYKRHCFIYVRIVLKLNSGAFSQ